MPWSSHENSHKQTEEYAITLAHLIHQHAPLLEELSVGRDDLASAVEQAYEELKDALESHSNVAADIVMSE
jgi:hypothetical protein